MDSSKVSPVSVWMKFCPVDWNKVILVRYLLLISEAFIYVNLCVYLSRINTCCFILVDWVIILVLEKKSEKCNFFGDKMLLLLINKFEIKDDIKSSAIVHLENELKHIPITLSWENITVHTPSSRESLTGKLKYLICEKETPPKQIINNGKANKNYI